VNKKRHVSTWKASYTISGVRAVIAAVSVKIAGTKLHINPQPNRWKMYGIRQINIQKGLLLLFSNIPVINNRGFATGLGTEGAAKM